jgi:flagellar hook-associated protein 2
MQGITFSGVGSGLDIDNLVGQLVAAEGQPAAGRLNNKEARLQQNLSAIGTLQAALAELKNAARAFDAVGSVESYGVSVGRDDLLAVTAGEGVEEGEYELEVIDTAKAQKLASESFASIDELVGEGSLSIRFGQYDSDGNTFTPDPGRSTVNVDLSGGGSTLREVRDAINQETDDVRASIVNDGSGYRLVVSSTNSGSASTLEISVDDTDGLDSDSLGLSRLSYLPTSVVGSGKNMEETVAGRDAKIEVDGLIVTSGSNSLKDVIEGVSFNLKQSESETKFDVKIFRDQSSLVGVVEDFVSSYNQVLEVVSSLTSYDAEKQSGGPLIGDSAVRSVTGQLRRIVGAQLGSAASDIRYLGNVGVTTQVDGSLALNESRLTEAIVADPQGVTSFFSSQGQGDTFLSARLGNYLDGVLGEGGIFQARTDRLNSGIEDINQQREILSERLDSVEKRFRAQFTAMDALVAELSATNSFLTQQLGQLSIGKNQ